MENIGRFKIIYLKEKLRRLEEFRDSEEYSSFRTVGDGVDLIIGNIKSALEVNDYSKIRFDNFFELKFTVGNIDTVIIESFSNKWVMKRRKVLVDILLGEKSLEDNEL